jgi:hypothetical protein
LQTTVKNNDMGFEKGKSGNPNGRKKGSQNKSTAELRGIIQEIISANFSNSKIARDLKELTPKYRLEFYLKLMEFLLPKLLPEETTNNEQRPNFFASIYHQIKSGQISDYPSTIQCGNEDTRVQE